jgi:ATP-binding cassette subfamily B protein
MELLKMLGITGQQISTLNTNTEDILHLELKKIRKIRALSFIQGIFINFFRQLLLLIFIWLIFRDELTAGKLITLSLFSFMIFNPLYDIGSTVLLYREAQVSLQNLGSILKRSPQKKIGEAVPMPGIEQMEFVDVSFKYPGSAHYALNNISFCVRKGQSVAFAGPSGAGKTTLVKLLIGLYPITEGAIFYNRVNAKDIDLDILLNQNGFVPQNTQLFAGTIRENMLLAKPTATNEEIEEALEKAACQGLLARAAEGIETVIGEGGIKISGGEKQRLSIARALLRKPQVLIFDEATSALDSITEDAVSQTIQSLSFNKQHIILLIAHRLSTIMHADTIYVLEKGSIAESGTHHALLAQKGLYYAMWRQQIGERREA